MAHKHVMAFRNRLKAERVIEGLANTHFIYWRKTYEYDEDGGLHPIYRIWYTQKEDQR